MSTTSRLNKLQYKLNQFKYKLWSSWLRTCGCISPFKCPSSIMKLWWYPKYTCLDLSRECKYSSFSSYLYVSFGLFFFCFCFANFIYRCASHPHGTWLKRFDLKSFLCIWKICQQIFHQVRLHVHNNISATNKSNQIIHNNTPIFVSFFRFISLKNLRVKTTITVGKWVRENVANDNKGSQSTLMFARDSLNIEL